MSPTGRRLRRGAEIGAFALVLGSFAAAAIGDATGLVRCEQHHLGTELEMAALSGALDAWARERGRYPSAAEGVGVVADRFDAGVPPRDHFGRPFSYRPPRAGDTHYELGSLGRDGTPGGLGEDADTTWRRPAAISPHPP